MRRAIKLKWIPALVNDVASDMTSYKWINEAFFLQNIAEALRFTY